MKIKKYIELYSEIPKNTDELTKEQINILLSNGILKVKTKDTSDEISKDDVKKKEVLKYIFNYVGIVQVKNDIIFVYPKYIKDMNKDDKYIKFKQIIEVIRKYNKSKFENIPLVGSEETIEFNLLSFTLDLLEMYYEFGIYTNEQEKIDINGEGDIFWDKTINEQNPLICSNKPIYFDVYTTRFVKKEEHICTLLHEIILSECSSKLSSILEVFDIQYVNLTSQKIDYIGDTQYLLNVLKNELNVQYITWKQKVLEKLIEYLTNENNKVSEETINFVGSTSFNLIWEDVCSKVLNDNKEDIVELGGKKQKLIEYIPEPKWDTKGKCNYTSKVRTYKPDILVIDSNNNLNIYDAKYYNLEQSRPGIPDITKQFFYQQVYEKYYENITNVFLVPIDEDKDSDYGAITFEELFSNRRIEVKLKSANKMYEKYLEK